MEISEKKEFMQLLAETMGSYSKPLPEGSILNAWWSNLAMYPLDVVRVACRAYRDEHGEFAPVPAGIAMLCKKMDGRPDPAEAWAIALTGQDEASTVVWTTETADAFNICRSVLMSANAISAWKPFLGAYTRLVAEARAEHRPMKIVVSIGSDRHHRATVIKGAIGSGLLPAPAAAPLLEGPPSDPQEVAAARAQLVKIRKMQADAAEKKEQARLEGVELQRLAYEEFNRSTEERVQKYLAGIKA